jgi:hypothetical protein
MVREALALWLAVVLLCVGAVAAAQPTNDATTATSDDGARANDAHVVERTTIGYIGAAIAIGRPGAGRIELRLPGGGGCGGYTSPWGLLVEQLDIRGEDCAAFKTQAAKLRPSRQRGLRWSGRGPIPTVRAGPFAIEDWAGYFELRSPKGRLAAERWVRRTLTVVRPCWRWDVTDDDSPRLVRRLYAEIAKRG